MTDKFGVLLLNLHDENILRTTPVNYDLYPRA